MAGKLTKLYDFALGALIGVGGTLLIQGHRNAALAVAVGALVLRATIGRLALQGGGEDR